MFRSQSHDSEIASRDVPTPQRWPLIVLILAPSIALLSLLAGPKNVAGAGVIGTALALVVWLAIALRRERNARATMEKDLAQRETTLALLREHFDEAQRLSNCGSCLFTEAGKLSASQQYLDLHRVSAENCPQTTDEYLMRFLVEPMEIESARANIMRHRSGQPTEGIRHVRLDDGTRKWFQFKNLPRFDAEGRLTGYFGITRDVTEEREAILALTARTSELERAKQIVGLGTWTWFPATDALVTCDYMAHLYGTTPHNQPKTMLEWARRFMPEEDFDAFLPLLQNCFDGIPFDRERRMISADGQKKWIRSIAEPVYDAGGTLTHYSGVTLDITRQKNALVQLATKTEQLVLAQQVGRMGSWYWDIKSDGIEFSDHYREIYEINAGAMPASWTEWARQFIEKFCHPDEREQAWTTVQRVAAGEAVESHRRIITAAGNPRWIHNIGQPVRNPNGAVVGFSGVTRDITDEKTRELQLTETTRQLSEAHRIAEMGHFYWDLATDKIEGYGDYDSVYDSTPETRFKTMSEWRERVCHPDDYDKSDENNATSVQRGDPYSVHRRIFTSKGEIRWVELTAEPVRTVSGGVAGYRGVARNITAQKTAEIKLQQSEEKFRMLTEISSDWFWETDIEHRFTFLSLEISLGSGKRREEIIGRTRWELFPEGMTAQQWQAHRETLAERRRFQGMVTRSVDHETGKITGFFSISGVPMHDAHGKFVGYRGIGRDITRIKLTEKAVAESEANFRLITQNMRDIIVLMRTDGKTFYLSPSFTRVTGHDIASSIENDAEQFFHPDDFVRVKTEFTRCVIGDGQPATMTYRFQHADGHYIWLEGQMHLVRNEDGLPKHVQISARDITSRRHAEIAVEGKTLELKEANAALEVEIRSRQELERNILMTIEMESARVGLELHDELGQDLTGIALLTKMLAQKLGEKSLEEAQLANRISELVNRTIGHTRMIAHGLSPYIWGSDGLAAALKQLAHDVNSLESVKCDARIPTAVTINDEVVALTLYRVAQEAVNNALKHSKAEKIRIALTRTSRGIELSVSDNGVGPRPAEDGAEEQHGLLSIRHRCRAIDATLSIGKPRLGGTMVRVMWRGKDSQKPPVRAKENSKETH